MNLWLRGCGLKDKLWLFQDFSRSDIMPFPQILWMSPAYLIPCFHWKMIRTLCLILLMTTADKCLLFISNQILIAWSSGKDPATGKNWGQEKRAIEDEMVGWHHWLSGHKFEQTLGGSEGQESQSKIKVLAVHEVAKVRHDLVTKQHQQQGKMVQEGHAWFSSKSH